MELCHIELLDLKKGKGKREIEKKQRKRKDKRKILTNTCRAGKSIKVNKNIPGRGGGLFA
jgi:hypothetical protein